MTLLLTALLAAPPLGQATLGRVEFLDPAGKELVAQDAAIEVLAGGFGWTEGPLWVPAGSPLAAGADVGMLLFSEIPSNTVYRWTEADGLAVFLKPSGYTGVGGYGGEPGSNGLRLDAAGALVSCEHGDRRVSRMVVGEGKRTLADAYGGKRLNSPNDLHVAKDGRIYFTDPPYGLPGNVDDPRKELDFQGVYLLRTGGEVVLLTDRMTRPNGVALSPDEKTLYVANSDSAAPVWMAFAVEDDGTTDAGRVFFDASAWVKEGLRGLPDGLKVDGAGNVWATGPGGLVAFDPAGKPLLRLATGQATSNCAFGGPDGRDLFLTVDMYVCRVRTTTTPPRR